MTVKNQSRNTLINYFFQNQHLICHHIVNKSEKGEEVDFESCFLSCYTLVNPNKSVHPIDLQRIHTECWSGLTIGIGVLRKKLLQ